MKDLIEFFLRRLTGKKKLQKFWEGWYKLGMRGMNYGNVGKMHESGELFVLDYLKEKLKNEKQVTIFDGGGYIGDYSVAISKCFKDVAVIHAFEPSAKTYKTYTENTKNLKNIIANNVGLSDKESKMTLYTDEDVSSFASVYKRNMDHLGIKMDMAEETKFTTIDKYCEENQIKRIHFLKLDIEGHELKAFQGAKNMINGNNIYYIQFEFGGCNIDSGTHFLDFYTFLKDKYRIYRILKDGIIEMEKYFERNEVYLATNYLAELKEL